ncbi:MAG: hypothetical protein EOP38_24070 [Rubrivivax sp.]|nr:MAG: hypothetical protein EOP38_24070 [Rubrivivax sp.]
MTHTIKTTRLLGALALLAASLACITQAQAANPTLTNSRAEFLTLTAGNTLSTQDFESYAPGTSMSGVDFLPGVSATTNLDSLAIFDGSTSQSLFATTRNQPDALYDIAITGGYRGVGFDIGAYDPATPGPGFISFYFADGDTTYVNIPVLPTNATESTPLFWGVISDVAVTRIVWSEGPELGGVLCCEETSLDNFVVAAPVPEASTGGLALAGLSVGAWVLRRRRWSQQG